jgi:flagellar M-ring protein FliF
VAAAFLFTRVSHDQSYTPLFTNLDAADASQITDALTAKGVPYELADSGRTVTVPQSDVYQLRIDLSAQGLPGSGGGYALLDNQGITTSEFRQRVDYQRALQGELEKTIAAMDGVQATSVHLVVPPQSVFADTSQPASASVLLRVTPGHTLSSSHVQAIVHLVASSVDASSPSRSRSPTRAVPSSRLRGSRWVPPTRAPRRRRRTSRASPSRSAPCSTGSSGPDGRWWRSRRP